MEKIQKIIEKFEAHEIRHGDGPKWYWEVVFDIMAARFATIGEHPKSQLAKTMAVALDTRFGTVTTNQVERVLVELKKPSDVSPSSPVTENNLGQISRERLTLKLKDTTTGQKFERFGHLEDIQPDGQVAVRWHNNSGRATCNMPVTSRYLSELEIA